MQTDQQIQIKTSPVSVILVLRYLLKIVISPKFSELPISIEYEAVSKDKRLGVLFTATRCC